MNKRDWYKFQVVGEGDLDGLEADIEQAIADALATGTLGAYPISGLAAVADGTTMVLSVSAGLGLAGDSTGRSRFVRLTAGATKSLASAVPTVNPRWATLALHFVRNEHQVVIDGDNVSLKYYQDEGAELVVLTGAEAASPVKPSIPDDHIPLVDVRLTVGQTAVHPYHCDYTRTRPSWAKTTGGPVQQLADLAALQLDNCRGYVVAPQSANAMQIGVRPGVFNTSSGVVTVAGGTVTLTAPPTLTLHYIALVYADDAGALHADYGDETFYSAAAPSFEGRFPICTIPITHGDTTLDPNALVDVRPHARMARDVPNVTVFTAVGGEDFVYTDGWRYVPGSKGLLVYKNGLLLNPLADYIEAAGGDYVTLQSSAMAADVFQLVAPRIAGTNPVTSHAATHGADGADAFDFASIGGLVLPGFEAYSSASNLVSVRPFAAVIDGKLRRSTTTLNHDFDANPKSASTWYYAYAYWTGGAMALEFSTTAPDADRRLKTGDASRTFLFPVRTTGGATHYARAFWIKNRVCHYDGALSGYDDPSNAVDNSCIVKITAAGGVDNDQDVSGWVPPWVYVARFGARVTSSNAGNTTTLLGGGVGGPGRVLKVQVANFETVHEGQFKTGAAQVLRITNNDNAVTTRLYALCYEF